MTAITLERRGEAGWITFRRPDARNAFTGEMVSAFRSALQEAKSDAGVRVVVLHGEGIDFCSGADMAGLAEMMALDGPARAKAAYAAIDEEIYPLLKDLLALPQPVVASVRGNAIGLGVQFVLAADLVVASDTASFILPQVRLAHNLDHGESWLLPRKIGLGRAMQIALTGDPVSAADAERYGFVNWQVADDTLEDHVDKLVRRLLALAPLSLMRTKQLFEPADLAQLHHQIGRERDLASAGIGSDDFVEAINAFQQKRKPRFAGR